MNTTKKRTVKEIAEITFFNKSSGFPIAKVNSIKELQLSSDIAYLNDRIKKLNERIKAQESFQRFLQQQLKVWDTYLSKNYTLKNRNYHFCG